MPRPYRPLHFSPRHTLHDSTHPLGGNILGVVLHLHKDKFAVALVLFIQIQHRMGRRSRTGERVENNIVSAAHEINKI